MNREYYEQYRSIEMGHWWFQGREHILKTILRQWLAGRPQAVRPRILNVGCATGWSSEWLGEFGEVESVEYDEECAQMARELTGLQVRQGDVEKLDYADGAFDIVTAFDVLEHVDRDAIGVKELQRVCAPGGIVLVTAPAFHCLWSDHDEVNHHRRRYLRDSFAALFKTKGAGGAVVSSGYFNCWLFPVVFALRMVRRLLKKVLGPARDKAAVSDFEWEGRNPFAPLLRFILASEAYLILRGWPLPVGTSTFVLWRQDAPASQS